MSNKPIPKPTPETANFWSGCAAGELRLQHCTSCGHVQYPPRKLCSGCFSQDVEWRRASGHGKIRSWSVVIAPGAPGFEAEVPFISALIALDEGPTMLSVLRECAAADVEFEQPVEVIFEQRGEQYVPYFKPASTT
ncbi:MAG: DNA-binding protein [Pseudomonadales bacterium]|nr:DNA-binding protein [Pseudomonadales bacterium]